MSKVAEQHLFMMDIVRLLQFAWNKGFVTTFGEAFRTQEQQEIYVKTGKSKTLDSYHLKRLALDLNIFKDGRLATKAECDVLGKFWEDLDPKNRWGGNFDRDWTKKDNFLDAPHFERRAF